MPESFFGSGHTLRLLKSADVQMVSEDVTIWPTCGATTTMHRVDSHCVFVLKNLSNKSVSIQVGFPLDRQSHLIEEDETDLVLSTHFIGATQATLITCDMRSALRGVRTDTSFYGTWTLPQEKRRRYMSAIFFPCRMR